MRLVSGFLSGMLLLLPLGGCGDRGGSPGRNGTSPPGNGPYNVLLISVDTLRSDHLSFYGYPRRTSPDMDRFAARSVVFTDAHVQSTWTTPSHAALFTSLYPSVLGLRQWPDPGKIDPRAYTLAELLRDHGYDTAGFLEAGLVGSKFGFSQGFKPYRQGFHHIDESVPACLAWIDRREGRPFFAFLHTYDVHRYDPPEGFAGRFSKGYHGPVQKGARLRERIQKLANREFLERLDPADRQYIVDLYDEALLYVDHWLGRLFEGLEARGLFDNTIVILLSDHGEEFWDHGGTGHGYTNYEEILRVPLVIHDPRIPPGRREAPVGIIDVAPTVADMVGLTPPPAWQGRSFYDLLTGERTDRREFLFAERGHRTREGYKEIQSVQDDRWKLIRLQPPRGADRKVKYRLFDLREDPRERKDVSGLRPEVKDHLVKILEAWIEANRRRSKGYTLHETRLDEETRKKIEDLGYAGGK